MADQPSLLPAPAEAAPDLPEPRADQCDNCRFKADERGELQCRRYPPIDMVQHVTGRGGPSPARPIWPVVRLGDWCGEHQRAEA